MTFEKFKKEVETDMYNIDEIAMMAEEVTDNPAFNGYVKGYMECQKQQTELFVKMLKREGIVFDNGDTNEIK